MNDMVTSLGLPVFPNVPSYPVQASKDGEELGALDGSRDGEELGALDGNLLGCRLGDEEGSPVR